MNRRRGLVAVAAAAALSLLAGSLPGTAVANSSAAGQGSATARTAQTDAGTTKVTPSLTLLGVGLGGLADLVTSTLVNPLLSLPQNITTSLANSLTTPGLSASNGSTQQPRPGSGSYPACNQGGWTSSNCYGPATPTVSQPGLIMLTTGGLQGYATGDETGFAAAAHVANPVLTVFGIPIGDLGVVDSTASCTTSTCTADHTLTGGSLFSNALTYSLAGGSMLAKVGNTSVGSTPIKVADGVTATLADNLLTVTVAVSLTQLLGAIGTTLSTLGTALGGTLSDSGTTAALTVSIGPGQVTGGGGTSSSAWGLNVGLSLAADIKLKLGALANIGVTVTQATTGSPDLTNMRLAYSATTAGSGGDGSLLPGWVPPALI